MEQLRQVGEVLGSLKALMIFRDDIKVNRRQCDLLVDAFNLAFDSVADEIKKHLKLEEKLTTTKWKALEHPLRELHRIFREGEQYVKNCLEPQRERWWGKALALNQSTDCVELHLHNLLWCIPVVLEAIEAASEMLGCDQEEILIKRVVFSKKYDRDLMDPKLFEHYFGKLYSVSQDVRRRLDSAPREDRWLLSETVAEKRSLGSPRPSRKQESRLSELLLGPRGKLHQTSVGWPDYQVRRRLGSGSNLKEIQWMGESFAMRHAIGDVEQFKNEIVLLSSLAHPNVQSYMYVFSDEEKKECFMVMELMSKDLSSHMKEVCSARRRVPFPLLVAVDIMLQIARGMNYLHSKGIYHGDLNPRNILVKSRSSSPDGHMLVKIANFGLSPVKNSKPAANQAASNYPCIWYAPEVLSEQEKTGEASAFKFTEKADVYSFAMICFELLTGKVPFDENHLQGDKMSRNIKADVRPLFPFPSPKYLVSLTKRCWQSEPTQRPSFASICRMLRYIKRFLILNPDNGQPELPAPPLDYFDIEMSLSRRFPSWIKEEERVSDVPFQMYAYRVVERERTGMNVVKEKSSDSGSEGASISGEGNGVHVSTLSDDTMSSSVESTKSSSHASSESNNKGSSDRKVDEKTQNQTGQQKSRTVRPPPRLTPRTTRRLNSDSRIRPAVMNPARRRISGHASDSELSL